MFFLLAGFAYAFSAASLDSENVLENSAQNTKKQKQIVENSDKTGNKTQKKSDETPEKIFLNSLDDFASSKSQNPLKGYFTSFTKSIDAKNIYDSSVSFYKNSYIYEDKTRSQSWENVMNSAFANWKLHKESLINYRISKSEYWIYNKFNLLNSGVNYLILGSNLQDYIDAYIFDADNKLIEHYIGGNRSSYKRTDYSLLFNFKLPSRHQVKYPIGILLKLSSHDSIFEVNTAHIYSSSNFANLFDTEIFIYAVLFGITTIFVFFGLSLFLMIKERIYFYYALYVSSTIFWFIIHSGIIDLFFSINPSLKQYMINASLSFIIFFLSIFFIRFIDLRRYLPKINRYFLGYFNLILILSLFASAFENRLLFYALLFLMLGIGVFAFLLNLYYMHKNEINKAFVKYTFLIIAFVCLIFAIYFLINYFLTSEVFIKYGANFAIAINFMVITLAIGYKIQILENETNRSEDETSALLNKEIEKSTKDLVEINKRLNLLSIQDELTRVGNRRHYNQQINLALSQVEKNDISLGFALVDIDYFKFFNDSYGHMAGDKVLVRIAEEIKHSIYNTPAMVFRLGGEEFGIIMPNFSLREIEIIFNKLQKNIENLRIINEKAPLGILTISTGAVVADIPVGVTEEKLYSAADHLLYEAKKAGRNRIYTSVLSDIILSDDYVI